MSRFLATTPLLPFNYVPPGTSVFVPARALTLRQIVFLFWRVKSWRMNGTLNLAGLGLSIHDYDETLSLPYSDELANYADGSEIHLFHKEDYATGWSTTVSLRITRTARWGGGDLISNWSIPEIELIAVMAYDDPGLGAQNGSVDSLQAPGTSPSACACTFTATNLVDGASITFFPTLYFTSGSPSDHDIEGNIDFTAAGFWPYVDAEGIPTYSTSTGALAV